MREKSFLETAKEYQRELQTLGGMQAHERDLRALVVIVSVTHQSGMIQELVERFGAVARVHGRIHQFAEVFDTRISFRSIFFFQLLNVAGAVDEELEDVGGGDGRGREVAGEFRPSSIWTNVRLGVGARRDAGAVSHGGLVTRIASTEVEGRIVELGRIERSSVSVRWG